MGRELLNSGQRKLALDSRISHREGGWGDFVESSSVKAEDQKH